MREYKVIKFFTDLQDNNHPYNVGDVFPRGGAMASPERIAELSGNENRQGVPLIEICETAETETETETETGIDAETETEKPRRKRRSKK